MVTLRVALAALLVCACHHDRAAVKTTPAPVPAQTATATAAPPAQPVAVSSNLNASDDLVRRCEIHFANQQEAPKFDYDHADLTNEDRNVLSQIADCITKGP